MSDGMIDVYKTTRVVKFMYIYANTQVVYMDTSRIFGRDTEAQVMTSDLYLYLYRSTIIAHVINITFSPLITYEASIYEIS